MRALLGYEQVVVHEFEAAVLYSRGAYVQVFSPGVHWVRRRAVQIIRVDMRPESLSAEQWVETRDKVAVFLRWGARIRITDPRRVVENTKEYGADVHYMLQSAVKAASARAVTAELRGEAQAIQEEVKQLANQATAGIGISCIGFEVLEVRPAVEQQDANQQAIGFMRH